MRWSCDRGHKNMLDINIAINRYVMSVDICFNVFIIIICFNCSIWVIFCLILKLDQYVSYNCSICDYE